MLGINDARNVVVERFLYKLKACVFATFTFCLHRNETLPNQMYFLQECTTRGGSEVRQTTA